MAGMRVSTSKSEALVLYWKMVDCSLRVVGEAKNLGPISGPNRLRDLCTFCTISLDQEVVFRTKAIDKSLSPFYGEDFYFEIPRPFQCLSFYIYAKSVFQRDLPVGKVSIRKEDLCRYIGKEHWFGLQPVDPNSEVQGKVHLEMRLNNLITADNGSICQQLLVRIIECQGLPLISGQNCDPYATVSLVGPARSDQKKTKVKKKTSNPFFEETFIFEVTRSSSYSKKSHFQVEEEDIEKLEIKVDLWNNGNLAQDVFLGETRVSLKTLRNDHVHKAWYLLQPKGNGNKSKVDDLGSLRLKVTYTEDTVLPSACYSPLCNLLLKSPDVKPISASAAHILGDFCRERYEAVLPVVRLLLHHNRLVPFVTAVAALELENTQEANTIFRGNSLATRCIDDMMKIVGKNYLTVTLKPVLDEICESNKTCEIDPIKLKEGDNMDINKENLQVYVQKVFSSITQSSASCPPLMCNVFRSLRNMASKRFPADPHVQYSAVSSFVFLRFFAVAVVSPHSFQLRPHHPDPEISRTLTLISKTIQTLGSWISLSKNKQSSFKETYMYDFFKSFQEDKCIEEVKKFLDEISSNISKECCGMEDAVVLKEGEVQKRAQGRKRIGKKNFKKRWLRVTNRELSYHKHRGKEALCIIDVKNIQAVEKLEESAFNRKNMFQVVHAEKPLYVQAGNCVEASEWMEVLSQVSRCNERQLATFHPSTYSSGAWQCCKSLSDSAPGCKPRTTTMLANLQLDIDCDRETERVFSFLSTNDTKLQKMEDACASIAIYQGPQREQEEYSKFTIQDPKETFRTVKQLRNIMEELRIQHNTRSDPTAQYGSRDNPIVGKTS
ncbi:ras GTPase-activating protein 2 [Lampris incognitus]|uniref:ras GTPase-activating protein 2 n=1 Tax=Lampris incognitus TaxID=2546036 RepID=UPI0024B60F50|nr:ras GTPase-activating protein 2 [Lampris incognitus]